MAVDIGMLVDIVLVSLATAYQIKLFDYYDVRFGRYLSHCHDSVSFSG